MSFFRNKSNVANRIAARACVILSRMEHGRFVTLAAEFESLQNEIERTNDPALRSALLRELALKLRDLDEMAKSAIRDLAGEMPRRTSG